MEQGDLQCGVPVEWNKEFFRVGYPSNGTSSPFVWVSMDGSSSNGIESSSIFGTGRMEDKDIRLWVTSRMERGRLHYKLPFEWNGKIFSLGTCGMKHGSSTIWGTARMEHGFIQSGLPVEWNKKFFYMGYRWNEQGDLQYGVPVEWNTEDFSLDTCRMEHGCL